MKSSTYCIHTKAEILTDFQICISVPLMRQDINEKENEILDLNHRLEILSEVSELKLNDINNQITSIHTFLNNITSSNNDYSRISSNEGIGEIKFLKE